jgi:hypothetical protein
MKSMSTSHYSQLREDELLSNRFFNCTGFICSLVYKLTHELEILVTPTKRPGNSTSPGGLLPLGLKSNIIHRGILSFCLPFIRLCVCVFVCMCVHSFLGLEFSFSVIPKGSHGEGQQDGGGHGK